MQIISSTYTSRTVLLWNRASYSKVYCGKSWRRNTTLFWGLCWQVAGVYMYVCVYMYWSKFLILSHKQKIILGMWMRYAHLKWMAIPAIPAKLMCATVVIFTCAIYENFTCVQEPWSGGWDRNTRSVACQVGEYSATGMCSFFCVSRPRVCSSVSVCVCSCICATSPSLSLSVYFHMRVFTCVWARVMRAYIQCQEPLATGEIKISYDWMYVIYFLVCAHAIHAHRPAYTCTEKHA
jgi:hypothetical protein